jgi:hypothetical protein
MVQSKARAGETLAVGAITRCLELYGEHTLRVGLMCITKTGDGNPGFLRATIIEAFCLILNENRNWRDDEHLLLKAVAKFSIPDVWQSVTGEEDRVFPSTVRTMFAEVLRKHLARRMPMDKQAA